MFIKVNYVQDWDITTSLYPALPYTTLHYSTLPCTTLHCHTLPCNTLHYPTLPCTTLQYLHYHALPYTTLYYTALPYTSMCYNTLPCTSLLHHAVVYPMLPNYLAMLYNTMHLLPCTTMHYLHSHELLYTTIHQPKLPFYILPCSTLGAFFLQAPHQGGGKQ